MKTKLTLTAFLIAAAAAPLHAAAFKEAEITRTHNEVNVLKADKPVRAAVVGEQIGAVTSVATGNESRAEMRFPDKSLTRLGANSRFTIRGDQRTLELDEGVMLLQVPKQMGGAKVRTAAVTAAVTGTTVLFEYVKGGFVKLIVIEGSVDLYFNDKPGSFRTVNAGEMIIMKVDSKFIPDPVDVDLNLLLKTSKLISANDIGTPNLKQVGDAAKEQSSKLKKGELVKTNLIIPGRGTQVAFMTNTRLDLVAGQDGTQSGNNTPPPGNRNNGGGNNNNGNGGNGGSDDPIVIPTPIMPLISGTTVLNETSEVRTNPHVDAFNSENGFDTYEGAVYDANLPYSQFAFGENTNLVNPDATLALNSGAPWAAFKFEELLINGSPLSNIEEGGIYNVIFSALNNIRLTEDNTFGPNAGGSGIDEYQNGLHLGDLGLDNLVLYSQDGNILIGPGFGIYGDYTNLTLVAASNTSDISIQSDVDLGFYYWEGEGFQPGGNLTISAGRDLIIGTAPVSSVYYYYNQLLNGGEISAAAGRDITIKGTDVQSNTRTVMRAGRTINIDSSTTLRVLSDDPNALLQLVAGQDVNIDGSQNYYETLEARNIDIQAQNGNITLNSVTNSGATDVFKARALGTNGWITIGNSVLSANQIMKLYAEGNGGGVRFVSNSTLNGNSIHIAGRTVDLANESIVTVNGNATVYADSHLYNNTTRTNVTGKGTFRNSENAVINVQERGFNQGRPQY